MTFRIVLIFHLQSVETMRIERIRTFVTHHSTVLKYMAKINPVGMVLGYRWDGLSGAEWWY